MSNGRLKVTLQPTVLRWARERVGLDPDEVARKIGVQSRRVYEWESTGELSFSQAERLARCTHTPVGLLYLPRPPEDELPIRDFRTVGDQPMRRPSPDLLETVHDMQRRQRWMRQELVEGGADPIRFVGTASVSRPPAELADELREDLGLADHWAGDQRSWTEALRYLRDQVENAGVLVVFNGIVGNNTHRKLNPDEFRGFALVDAYAPLVFVNGADFKAAQMFTLVHELVHLWIGAEGVSNFETLEPSPHETEKFCNAVAAEFLVPERELRSEWSTASQEAEPFQALARRFKVSTIVAARRALDISLIDRPAFLGFYRTYVEDERRRQIDNSGGGSFWNNQTVRVGRRFGAAVARAVKEDRLLYRDAYHLTGLRGKTFDKFIEKMEA